MRILASPSRNVIKCFLFTLDFLGAHNVLGRDIRRAPGPVAMSIPINVIVKKARAVRLQSVSSVEDSPALEQIFAYIVTAVAAEP